ncbi:MAG TPA: GH32 C-terminal domain-containing protein, partial [Acidobacteriaceae bacterium]|nr:GH32 C-terminal domain-containing protein [Acidobacteriaceae bacterium]
GKQIDTANQVDSGDMWECPDIFLLDGQHVLIYSTAGKSCWESGELDPKEMVFHRKHSGVLDYGSFYAPKTQRDRSGQRILWGWIPETRPLEEYRAAGWAGMMSLPRVLNVSSKGNLSMRVFPKVGMLRKDEQVLAKSTDEKKNRRAIERLRLRGCCGEITCSFASSQKPFAFTLLLSPATTSEDVLISIQSDPAHPGHVLIDGKSIPIHVGLEDQLDLHMYVDGSVVELMVNQQAAYTKRFYYSGARSPEIALRVEGKTANIIKLAIWQFAPISPNRLTT